MLTLHEDLFLICLHEEKLVVIPSAEQALQVGLGGAVLADLAYSGRIETDPKNRVKIIQADPTGEPLLDEILSRIQSSENPRKISYWLDEIKIKPNRIFQQLVKKGVLEEHEDEIGWVTPYPIDSKINANASFFLKERLRTLGLAHVEPSTPELALLSLLKACDKLDLVFFKDERKIASRRIYEMVMSEALKKPATQILQVIEQAIQVRIETD